MSSRNNVIDITEQLAKRTAEHMLMLAANGLGEAGLTARLSFFDEDHIAKIMGHARQIRTGLTTS